MSQEKQSFKPKPFLDIFSGNLAIFCSDERFVRATLEFLNEELQVKTCDLLVVAGGPIFISKKERHLIERLDLLVNSHKVKSIILISHQDCGYYKYLYPKLSALELENLQLEDLRKALTFLKERDIEARAFFAYVEDDQILFRKIKEDNL